MAQFHTFKQIWKLTGMVSTTLQNTLKIEVCIHFHANFMVWYYHLLHTRITTRCRGLFPGHGLASYFIDTTITQSIVLYKKVYFIKIKSLNLSKISVFDIVKTQCKENSKMTTNFNTKTFDLKKKAQGSCTVQCAMMVRFCVWFLLQIFYRCLHQVATTSDFMLIGLHYLEAKGILPYMKIYSVVPKQYTLELLTIISFTPLILQPWGCLGCPEMLKSAMN